MDDLYDEYGLLSASDLCDELILPDSVISLVRRKNQKKSLIMAQTVMMPISLTTRRRRMVFQMISN